MRKLNLGCGKDIKEGWDHYDIYPLDDRVKPINLHKLPLPFPDNYADVVKLHHIVEHMVYRKEFMLEIARILKPGGRVFVRMPCFGPALDHKSWFNYHYIMVSVCKDLQSGSGNIDDAPRPYKLVKYKYTYGSPIIFLKRLMVLFRCMYSSSIDWEMMKK
jgi:SAM-dependent methyltransferase